MSTKLMLIALLALVLFSSCARSRMATMDTTDWPANQPDTPQTLEVPASPPHNEEPVVVREERVTAVDQRNDLTIYRYYVIIGSFRNLNNANRYAANLSSSGFQPVILANEAGLYRVSVGAFDLEVPARGRIAQIRRSHPQQDDVWQLVRNR